MKDFVCSTKTTAELTYQGGWGERENGSYSKHLPSGYPTMMPGSIKAVIAISAMCNSNVIALMFVSPSGVSSLLCIFFRHKLHSFVLPNRASSCRGGCSCRRGCMRGCLHCLSSGFIKPITCRNRHSWNLSQYDFYINAVKGGQRSLWSLFWGVDDKKWSGDAAGAR